MSKPSKAARRRDYSSREEDNEQLEFLGDAVLGLVVAEILFRRFPDLHEGEWTRLRASLVSRRHLAQVAVRARPGKLSAAGARRRTGRRPEEVYAAGELRRGHHRSAVPRRRSGSG